MLEEESSEATMGSKNLLQSHMAGLAEDDAQEIMVGLKNLFPHLS